MRKQARRWQGVCPVSQPVLVQHPNPNPPGLGSARTLVSGISQKQAGWRWSWAGSGQVEWDTGSAGEASTASSKYLLSPVRQVGRLRQASQSGPCGPSKGRALSSSHFPSSSLRAAPIMAGMAERLALVKLHFPATPTWWDPQQRTHLAVPHHGSTWASCRLQALVLGLPWKSR